MDFLISAVGSWERVIYALRHQARSTFAVLMQEMLTVSGPGSNGKSSLATRMETFLGSYSATIASEALTSIRDLDAPSQTMLALKAKRWISVRELAAGQRVRGHVIKTLADGTSVIKARGLYGVDQTFRPTFLLFVCTNSPLLFDEGANKGLERKIRVLTMPFHFTSNVVQANDRPLVADLEKRFPDWNASLFFLLRAVRRILMAVSANCVLPIPDEVQAAGVDLNDEAWMEQLQDFVTKRVRPAGRVEESASAAEVRAAFLSTFPTDVDKKNVGLKLAQQGFAEDLSHFSVGRKKTSKRTYSFAFGEPHGTCLVRLEAT